MRQKTFFAILFVIFTFSVSAYAQPVDVEAEFGDGTRSLKNGAVLVDFGEIEGDYQEKSIEIVNHKPTKLKIRSIEFTGGGVGVSIVDDIIPGKSKKNIIISVYPNYIKEDEFTRDLLISTETHLRPGVVVVEETLYRIKGTIKR